jgi:hypothetical protein
VEKLILRILRLLALLALLLVLEILNGFLLLGLLTEIKENGRIPLLFMNFLFLLILLLGK